MFLITYRSQCFWSLLPLRKLTMVLLQKKRKHGYCKTTVTTNERGFAKLTKTVVIQVIINPPKNMVTTIFTIIKPFNSLTKPYKSTLKPFLAVNRYIHKI